MPDELSAALLVSLPLLFAWFSSAEFALRSNSLTLRSSVLLSAFALLELRPWMSRMVPGRFQRWVLGSTARSQVPI